MHLGTDKSLKKMCTSSMSTDDFCHRQMSRNVHARMRLMEADTVGVVPSMVASVSTRSVGAVVDPRFRTL